MIKNKNNNKKQQDNYIKIITYYIYFNDNGSDATSVKQYRNEADCHNAIGFYVHDIIT